MTLTLVYIHFLLVTLLLRSGLHLLGAFPRFYLNDQTIDGKEWIRFDRKNKASVRPYYLDDVHITFSSWIALPGGKGGTKTASAWHQFSIVLFLLNGISYLAVVQEFPLKNIFWMLLGILILMTSLTALPNWMGRFPSYLRLMGGRQKARSLHFLSLVAVAILSLTYLPLLKSGRGLLGLIVILFINLLATLVSKKKPQFMISFLETTIYPIVKILTLPLSSRQHYSIKEISPKLWIKGNLPQEKEWNRLAKEQFTDYKLKVTGLVHVPLNLSLQEIKKLPHTQQITTHLGQGWSGVAQWEGVSLSEIMELCRPLKEARYILFRSHQKDETVILSIRDAFCPQMILAYKLNDQLLPLEHGAPLRLRAEGKPGHQMIKWLKEIEFISKK